MKFENSTRPLIKLPQNVQCTVFLIKEELKCRKLFRTLHKIGLNECTFQPHLDSLILQSAGLDDGTDETFRIYERIMEEKSEKLEPNYDSIMTQAMEAYIELMNEKKKLSENKSTQ